MGARNLELGREVLAGRGSPRVRHDLGYLARGHRQVEAPGTDITGGVPHDSRGAVSPRAPMSSAAERMPEGETLR